MGLADSGRALTPDPDRNGAPPGGRVGCRLCGAGAAVVRSGSTARRASTRGHRAHARLRSRGARGRRRDSAPFRGRGCGSRGEGTCCRGCRARSGTGVGRRSHGGACAVCGRVCGEGSRAGEPRTPRGRHQGSRMAAPPSHGASPRGAPKASTRRREPLRSARSRPFLIGPARRHRSNAPGRLAQGGGHPRTGAHTFPRTGRGSKGTGTKHLEPSRTRVVLKVFSIASGTVSP